MHLLLLLLLLLTPIGSLRAEISFSAPLKLPAGTAPAAVASGELTGDSHLDLIAVHRASDDAFVYVGDGSGGFQFLNSFSVGEFPQGVVVSSFNAGAQADIATTAVPFNSGTVTAWLGNGDGTFASSDVLTADDQKLYEQACERVLSPDCAAWLERGDAALDQA